MSDNKKYIAELSVGNNYKQAISIIVYDKLKQNNVGLYPSMQDVMDTEDIAFTDYIFAVVTNAAELQTIFKETDSDLAITERFGIAYEAYMNLLEKKMAASMRPTIENCNFFGKRH